MKKVLSLIIVLCALPLVAMAAPPKDPIYFGAGLSQNSISGASKDGTGFQFFGGYELGNLGVKNNKINFAVEVGYMDTGDIEVGGGTFLGIPLPVVDASANGLWGTGLVRFTVKPQLDLLGRLGLDLGDDDGFMFGVGVGYSIDKDIQLRGEYVIRDNIDSIQFNVTFRI